MPIKLKHDNSEQLVKLIDHWLKEKEMQKFFCENSSFCTPEKNPHCMHNLVIHPLMYVPSWTQTY